jgi:hypothetical protein
VSPALAAEVGEKATAARWEGRGFTGCGKTLPAVILSPFVVILSAAKNLALPAQGKLREGSRFEYFQGSARFFVACGSSAETRRVSPWNSARVARTCFLGPRLVPDGQGKAADLKNRSATLPRPEFLPIMGSRKAVNAQNDSEGAQDDSMDAFWRTPYGQGSRLPFSAYCFLPTATAFCS